MSPDCESLIPPKQNLLEAFSELIQEEILDQPHLVRKVSLGVQNLVNSDELSQRHPIRKLGLNQQSLFPFLNAIILRFGLVANNSREK